MINKYNLGDKLEVIKNYNENINKIGGRIIFEVGMIGMIVGILKDEYRFQYDTYAVIQFDKQVVFNYSMTLLGKYYNILPDVKLYTMNMLSINNNTSEYFRKIIQPKQELIQPKQELIIKRRKFFFYD